MVVQSGIFPYQYHQSSWIDSQNGTFRIPVGHEGLISPSAIHFEEAMYVTKAEFSRIVARESGYRNDVLPIPNWLFKSGGKFQASTNAGNSGQFDPNPSGAFLDGTLKLTYLSNFGAMTKSVNIPAEFQSEEYIGQLRDICDDIFDEYSNVIGPWDDIFPGSPDTSGAKRDWLVIYKGYTDAYAESGKWFLEDEILTTVHDDDALRMPSGIFFDRYLDEVRLQPIPTLSRNNGTNVAQFFNDDVDWPEFGWQFGHVSWNRRPFRPIYLMTNGNLPSGHPSGLFISVDWEAGSPDRPSGVGSHHISGMQLALSGTDGTWTALSGDWHSDFYDDTYPESPSACRFENIQPSGKASISSGQYRIMIQNPGDQVSFPWGVSGLSHRGAIWPYETTFEPDNGRQLSVSNRFWDITLENMSFWITDHTFCYRNNNGKTVGASPHVNSGINWLMNNNGPSNHMNLIDGWNMDSPRNSGMQLLYGNAKGLGKQAADAENSTFGWIFGGGWAYDRSVNDYMIVGRSGQTGSNPARISGIYGRWNQQMVFQQGDTFGPKTAGGIRWHVSNAYNNAFDEIDWIINGAIVSGLNGTPRVELCWARVDTSYNLRDAIIGNNIGWVNYLRGRSEYLALDFATISDANDIPGKASGEYKDIVPTWGTLATIDSAGSGSISTTTYNLTYGSAMSGIINIATETARSRIHICKFFESEPDNDVYCTFIAFSVGANSGTSRTPDLWVGKLDSSSHPFEMTDAWMLQSLGTSLGNARLGGGFGVAHGDAGSFDHMEIHING